MGTWKGGIGSGLGDGGVEVSVAPGEVATRVAGWCLRVGSDAGAGGGVALAGTGEVATEVADCGLLGGAGARVRELLG